MVENVEQRGVVSNYFMSDLELLNKKIASKILEAIGSTRGAERSSLELF